MVTKKQLTVEGANCRNGRHTPWTSVRPSTPIRRWASPSAWQRKWRTVRARTCRWLGSKRCDHAVRPGTRKGSLRATFFLVCAWPRIFRGRGCKDARAGATRGMAPGVRCIWCWRCRAPGVRTGGEGTLEAPRKKAAEGVPICGPHPPCALRSAGCISR